MTFRWMFNQNFGNRFNHSLEGVTLLRRHERVHLALFGILFR
jgi:hypothetical protein